LRGAGRLSRITFYKLEKMNGSYHANFNLVQPEVTKETPRPGFAIIVDKEEGTWPATQLTGTVLVGESLSDAWFNAALFATSDTKTIVNGTSFSGTVELPDDNTAGGRQNAAIVEAEVRSHEARAEHSTTTSDLPTNALSVPVASEPASQPIPKKREHASTPSTFHEALVATAAKMTSNSHLHPTTPNTNPAPRPPEQFVTHDKGSRRRKRPADNEWNMEEAMARFRSLPAPTPTPWTEFDDMWQLKAARDATARRERESAELVDISSRALH
jgi:hypothetical protein